MLKEDVANASDFFTTTASLLTTASKNKRNVMACEWTFNISYSPFLIGIFVNPKHYTYKLLNENLEFGVSMACVDQAGLVHSVGNTSGRHVDKFKKFKIKTMPSKFIKPPLVKGSVMNAECKVIMKKKIGDHELFVGKVLRALVDDEKKPFAMHGGKFYHLGKKVAKKHISQT